MRAIRFDEYGGPEVLHLAELDRPTPAANQILVKVHAAALNPVDWHFVRGAPFPLRVATGLMKPRRPRQVGCDYAGTVEAVGPGVSGFAIGGPVFGLSQGTLAEYVVVPADSGAVSKPERLTHEQAAGVALAGLTALQALRDKAHVGPGQKILIVGAAGGIGSLAVQIAKAFGAEVTGVQSTAALDLVRALGADRVIDYTKEDFTTGGVRYDAVFDNVASRALPDVLRVLKPGGTLIPNGGGSPEKSIDIKGLVRMLAIRPFIKQRIALMMARPNRADLQVLADLIDAGRMMPVVDRCYPLTEAADALRYLEGGHAHGKVIVRIRQEA